MKANFFLLDGVQIRNIQYLEVNMYSMKEKAIALIMICGVVLTFRDGHVFLLFPYIVCISESVTNFKLI